MQTDQNRRQQEEFDRQQRERQQRDLEAARRNANRGGGGGGGGGGSGCFSATTRVLTPAGWHEIANIAVGDLVLTYRQAEQRLGEQEVFKIRHRMKRRCLKIELDNGSALEVTRNHPLLLDTGWGAARRLETGSQLIHLNQGKLSSSKVVSVEHKQVLEDVFHLYCGEDHTYIVESAVSHCFAFARSIRGRAMTARYKIGRKLSAPEKVFA